MPTASPSSSPSTIASPRGRRLLVLVAVFLACFGASLARAHALHFTRLTLSVVEGDAERVELRLETDLAPPLVDAAEAAALPDAPPHVAAPRLTALSADILAQIAPEFSPPAEPWRLAGWSFPAALPEAPRAPGDPYTVAFVWRARLTPRPDGENLSVLVRSRPDARLAFPVACSVSRPGDSGLLTHWLRSPGDATRPLPWGVAAAAPAMSQPAEAGRFATAAQYLWQGFLHILPLGVDHILFVLGLYFLGSGWRALAAQVGTFTLAHTTTLGLAAAGVVRVSPAIVEPLIALSITFVALENIFRPRVGAGRLVAVFAFGLLHGLGFAGALSELELPRDQFFTALLAFNFGVDFGQLAVLALAFLTVGWFRARPWYRGAIAVPACSLIAAIGVYWTIERAFF